MGEETADWKPLGLLRSLYWHTTQKLQLHHSGDLATEPNSSIARGVLLLHYGEVAAFVLCFVFFATIFCLLHDI
jgi:hypothetical protein